MTDNQRPPTRKYPTLRALAEGRIRYPSDWKNDLESDARQALGELAALREQQGEPVAWLIEHDGTGYGQRRQMTLMSAGKAEFWANGKMPSSHKATPLYTAPQPGPDVLRQVREVLIYADDWAAWIESVSQVMEYSETDKIEFYRRREAVIEVLALLDKVIKS